MEKRACNSVDSLLILPFLYQPNIKKVYLLYFFLLPAYEGITCPNILILSFKILYFNKNVHDTRTKNLFFTQSGKLYTLTGYINLPGNGSVDAGYENNCTAAHLYGQKAIEHLLKKL